MEQSKVIPAKYLKIVLNIVCLIGCFYQSYQISHIYFRYDTTTYVKFENSGYLQLPGITICYYKFLQLSNEFRHFRDETNLRTIGEQFNSLINMTQPLLIKYCILKKGFKKDYDSKCKDFGDSNGEGKGVLSRISGSSYCFTYFSQINGTSDEKYRINGTNSADWGMVQLGLTDKPPKLNIRLHDRKENLRHTYLKGYNWVHFKNAREHRLMYTKTVVKYLFNPKDRPCFDQGHTRDDCMLECKIEEFINTTGRYPLDFLNDNSQHTDLKYSSWHDVTHYEWTDKCLKKCNQNTDCYKEFFSLDSREHDSQEFKLQIEFPSHPTTIYEISIKMSFEEYLAFLASIFSIWFGFSMLSLTDFCNTLYFNFNNIYQKYIIKQFKHQKLHINHVNINVRKSNLNIPRSYGGNSRIAF